MQEMHYKYFKDLYDEESRRALELHDNAKTNTTIVTVYAAFLGLAATGPLTAASLVQPSLRSVPAYLFIAALIFLFLSIIISLYTTRVRAYQVPNYPRDVFDKLDDYSSDSEFYEDRVIDLVAAYDWNSAINDRKVLFLSLARLFLLLGMSAHFSYHIVVFLKL